ncbi:pyridoxamine 5'-phosphate oxidase family protein [Actinosynnema sp. NPDC059335]|uniref:pyridoxamine 5'-phosphate oxidase family protein n=1 Tax=Actinosynnema sp. NPDC059335 TaxID=3346804 RepID=UPI00366FAF70
MSDPGSTRVDAFAELQGAFMSYVQRIAYATMTTVDRRNRPRGRVLLPVWQVRGGRPVGWIAANRTPVKVAHLARNPHATISYWDRSQDAVFADCTARWVEDRETRAEVWDVYRAGSPPGVGYDPIRFWPGGPADPGFAVIRLDPWRVQVVDGRDLTSRIWTAPEPGDAAPSP